MRLTGDPVELVELVRRLVEVARRHIDGDGVAGDILHRLLRRHIARGLADDGGELDFPIVFLGAARHRDGCAGPDHGIAGRFEEKEQPLGFLFHAGESHLGHVVVVIGAGAQDFSGIKQRRQEFGVSLVDPHRPPPRALDLADDAIEPRGEFGPIRE